MAEDHALFGHVFKILTVSKAVECFRKCRSDCQCISFNYLTTVNQDNCELNEENKYLKPNALQAKQGSQYYDLIIDYIVVVRKQTAYGKMFSQVTLLFTYFEEVANFHVLIFRGYLKFSCV